MSTTSKKEILVAAEFGARTDLVPAEIRRLFPEESEGMGATVLADGGLTGLAAGVNDPSAHLVPSFEPTRQELGVLALHYYNQAREMEHWREVTAVTIFSEVKMQAFAWKRFETIADLLGEEEAERAIAKSRSEWDANWAALVARPRCQECGFKHKAAWGCNDCGSGHGHAECPTRPSCER